MVWRDVAIHAPRMFNAICPAELASQKAQAVFTGTMCTAAELSYSKCPQYHKLCKYNTEKLGGPICSWDWKLEVWRIEGIAGSMCLCWCVQLLDSCSDVFGKRGPKQWYPMINGHFRYLPYVRYVRACSKGYVFGICPQFVWLYLIQ